MADLQLLPLSIFKTKQNISLKYNLHYYYYFITYFVFVIIPYDFQDTVALNWP